MVRRSLRSLVAALLIATSCIVVAPRIADAAGCSATATVVGNLSIHQARARAVVHNWCPTPRDRACVYLYVINFAPQPIVTNITWTCYGLAPNTDRTLYSPYLPCYPGFMQANVRVYRGGARVIDYWSGVYDVTPCGA